MTLKRCFHSAALLAALLLCSLRALHNLHQLERASASAGQAHFSLAAIRERDPRTLGGMYRITSGTPVSRDRAVAFAEEFARRHHYSGT